MQAGSRTLISSRTSGPDAQGASFGARAKATLAALTLGLTAACQELPEVPNQRVQAVVDDARLAEVNPNDVVVPPLILPEDADFSAPDRPLRVAFQRALIRHRYVPLGLDFVDGILEGEAPLPVGSPAEAAYRPGRFHEDAVLEIHVHGFSDSAWTTRRSLTVDLEVRLLDAGQPATAEPLWSSTISDRFAFADREILHATESGLLQDALDTIARQMLQSLPIRRVEPGQD